MFFFSYYRNGRKITPRKYYQNWIIDNITHLAVLPNLSPYEQCTICVLESHKTLYYYNIRDALPNLYGCMQYGTCFAYFVSYAKGPNHTSGRIFQSVIHIKLAIKFSSFDFCFSIRFDWVVNYCLFYFLSICLCIFEKILIHLFIHFAFHGIMNKLVGSFEPIWMIWWLNLTQKKYWKPTTATRLFTDINLNIYTSIYILKTET